MESEKGDSDGGLPEIPDEAGEMIKRVREVVENFTDKEIYAVLLQCDMDPNDAISRLLARGTLPKKQGKPTKRKKKKKKQKKSKTRVQGVSSSSNFGGRGGKDGGSDLPSKCSTDNYLPAAADLEQQRTEKEKGPVEYNGSLVIPDHLNPGDNGFGFEPLSSMSGADKGSSQGHRHSCSLPGCHQCENLNMMVFLLSHAKRRIERQIAKNSSLSLKEVVSDSQSSDTWEVSSPGSELFDDLIEAEPKTSRHSNGGVSFSRSPASDLDNTPPLSPRDPASDIHSQPSSPQERPEISAAETTTLLWDFESDFDIQPVSPWDWPHSRIAARDALAWHPAPDICSQPPSPSESLGSESDIAARAILFWDSGSDSDC